MNAMVLEEIGSLEKNRTPLKFVDLPIPAPGKKELLIPGIGLQMNSMMDKYQISKLCYSRRI
jgi:NADPH:quinone reductase-like Zn-dependent oxidoreductase